MKKAAPFGYEPKTLVAAVEGHQGHGENDGTETNDKRFLGHLRAGELGRSPPAAPPCSMASIPASSTVPAAWVGEPLTAGALTGLKAKAMTWFWPPNSFSPGGVETCLGGLLPATSHVTAYGRTATTRKPNPEAYYYGGDFVNIGKRPQECLPM